MIKLKRLQVVTSIRNKRVLQVICEGEGSGLFHSITDLTTLRGTMMFHRLLLKRLKSSASYKLNRKLDVAALMVNSFQAGEEFALNADGDDDSLTLNTRSLVAITGQLSENNETTDAFMDIHGHYMLRYGSLFTHLYGKALRAQGVDLED